MHTYKFPQSRLKTAQSVSISTSIPSIIEMDHENTLQRLDKCVDQKVLTITQQSTCNILLVNESCNPCSSLTTHPQQPVRHFCSNAYGSDSHQTLELSLRLIKSQKYSAVALLDHLEINGQLAEQRPMPVSHLLPSSWIPGQ